ncbi:cytochrome P450 [Colletotrichum asianum]
MRVHNVLGLHDVLHRLDWEETCQEIQQRQFLAERGEDEDGFQGFDVTVFLLGFQHLKRLSKGKMGNDIGRHQCPPFQNVGFSVQGVGFDPLNSPLDLLPDDTLPVLAQRGTGECTSKELSARSMFLRIDHGEDSRLDASGDCRIPWPLQKARANLVNRVKVFRVGDGNLGGRNPDDGAVSMVKRMHIVHAPAGTWLKEHVKPVNRICQESLVLTLATFNLAFSGQCVAFEYR